MKRTFSSLLIIIFLFSFQLSSFANSIFASTETNIFSNDKLSEELKCKIEEATFDEYIPVCVWLNDIYKNDTVYSILSKSLGLNINESNETEILSSIINKKIVEIETHLESCENKNNFSSEDLFNNLSFDNKIKIITAHINPSSKSLSYEEIKTALNSKKSYKEIISLYENNLFISQLRASIKSTNNSINKNFVDSLNPSKYKNIYCDPLLPKITLEATKLDILTLCLYYNVDSIGYKSNDDFVNNNSKNTTYASSGQGYLMTPHDTLGYYGNGIKIGVIEVDAPNNYYTDYIHLQNANISTNGNGTTNKIDHATTVLSIICGQPVNVNGITYMGIAPDASVFFTNYENTIQNPFDWEQKLNWLIIEKNVSIINYSVGTEEHAGKYEEKEQYIDALIKQYRVVFVKSAGNTEINRKVTNPGLTYNGITVGNLSNTLNSDGKYKLSDQSCYNEENYLTNKPDLVAFGTNIYFAELNNNSLSLVNHKSGTSFAAPMVSATVALMMEANPKLIGKPDSIKALLLNACDEQAVSIDINPTVLTFSSNQSVTNIVREKTGAGLLNITGSISLAMSKNIYRFSIPNNISDQTVIPVNTLFINRYDTVEVSLVFEKSNTTLISSNIPLKYDFDIEITNGDALIMKSTSSNNNTETFKIEFDDIGNNYMHFQIKCNDNSPSQQINCYPNTFVSMVISCGCSRPSTNIENCTPTEHNVRCSNCGIWCKEPHDSATTTQQYETVSVKYEVFYKVHPFNLDYSDIICYFDAYPILTTTNSSNNANYIQDMSYTEYRSDKRWDLLNFEIIVFDSTYSVVSNFISTVYINLYYTGECNFIETI